MLITPVVPVPPAARTVPPLTAKVKMTLAVLLLIEIAVAPAELTVPPLTVILAPLVLVDIAAPVPAFVIDPPLATSNAPIAAVAVERDIMLFHDCVMLPEYSACHMMFTFAGMLRLSEETTPVFEPETVIVPPVV
jgi:hypothetical protein